MNYASEFVIHTLYKPPPAVRSITSHELKYVISDLVEIFAETVNSGSPLGFMPPISRDQSLDYWISLLPELESGARKLVVASSGNRIVGSGQLALSTRGNSPHRAEIQRLFVAASARGEGLGKLLMNALHDVAKENGRSLITLNTRYHEPPHHFYKSLGYREVGVTPGWTIGANGERYDHVTMYIEL